MIDPDTLADTVQFTLATREAVARNAPPEEHTQIRKAYFAKLMARWTAGVIALEFDDDNALTMDVPRDDATDPYNTAIAALLRARKAELRVTFPTLETVTGIKLRQLKALVNDEVAIRMGDFIKLATALGMSPAKLVQAAADRVEKTAV